MRSEVDDVALGVFLFFVLLVTVLGSSPRGGDGLRHWR
jgi:hypothetical protein